ncbi:hypothetical protein JTB14_017659 [Gonioctena quinquepunctata]|nr:hypothetical protein JTB14_017659 [Gonioctena quinquepunctata]
MVHCPEESDMDDLINQIKIAQEASFSQLPAATQPTNWWNKIRRNTNQRSTNEPERKRATRYTRREYKANKTEYKKAIEAAKKEHWKPTLQ